MSEKPTVKAKKRILPKSGKRETIQDALDAINKQYGKTLARLAK